MNTYTEQNLSDFRTFLFSPALDEMVRTVSAARQSKTLPVSALLLEKYFRRVHIKIVACVPALLKCIVTISVSKFTFSLDLH